MSGVLRYSVGDEVSFTDGKGVIGTARLTSLKKKEAQAKVIEQKLVFRRQREEEQKKRAAEDEALRIREAQEEAKTRR